MLTTFRRATIIPALRHNTQLPAQARRQHRRLRQGDSRPGWHLRAAEACSATASRHTIRAGASASRHQELLHRTKARGRRKWRAFRCCPDRPRNIETSSATTQLHPAPRLPRPTRAAPCDAYTAPQDSLEAATVLNPSRSDHTAVSSLVEAHD